MTVKVFLSSTGKDLADHRDAVYAAVETVDDYHCVRMEEFGARNQSPEEICRQKVSECDVYVGIIGHLYGSCPPGKDQSYTRIEYGTAEATKMPMLLFVAPDDFPIRAEIQEEDGKRAKQQEFRCLVDRKHMRSEFASPSDLATKVLAALRNQEKRQPEKGSDEYSRKPAGEKPESAVAPVVQTGGKSNDKPQLMTQISEPLRIIEACLAKGDTSFFEQGTEALAPFHVARVHLLAMTLAATHSSEEPLTNHQVNYLYKHGDDLKLTPHEAILLWKTVVTDSLDSKPGWKWFFGTGTPFSWARVSCSCSSVPALSNLINAC